MDVAEPVEVSVSRGPAVPYSTSWLDHLIDWLDRRPGPAWLAPYLLGRAIGA